MSATGDILQSYRRPGAVMARHLAAGRREDRTLGWLLVGCGLIWVACCPWWARQAEEGGVKLESYLYFGALFWLLAMPLVLLALGTLSHLPALIFGGRAGFHGARAALAWAVLAAAPLWLALGLISGLGGPGVLRAFAQAVAFGGFALIWAISYVTAERGRGAVA